MEKITILKLNYTATHLHKASLLQGHNREPVSQRLQCSSVTPLFRFGDATQWTTSGRLRKPMFFVKNWCQLTCSLERAPWTLVHWPWSTNPGARTLKTRSHGPWPMKPTWNHSSLTQSDINYVDWRKLGSTWMCNYASSVAYEAKRCDLYIKVFCRQFFKGI